MLLTFHHNMMKLVILFGLGACLGSTITDSSKRMGSTFTDSSKRMEVVGLRASDNRVTLASRIELGFVPTKGQIYILDLDADHGLAHSGCKDKFIKYPEIILRLEFPVTKACQSAKRVHVKAMMGDRVEQVPACAIRFRKPYLGFSHASHRFLAYFTETRPSVGAKDTLRLLSILMTWTEQGKALEDRYCLTAGMDETTICHCDDEYAVSHGEPKAIDFYPGDIRLAGSDLKTFISSFNHFLQGKQGVVLYVIDLDYDDRAGRGGCGSDKTPRGKVMAVILDATQPKSCPRGTTRTRFEWHMQGCVQDEFEWAPPQVPEGEKGHEWRVYLVDYLVEGWDHGTPQELVEVLTQAGAVPATMCFEEQMRYAVPGACKCTGSERPNSIQVKDATPYDTRWELAMWRISFDYYPARGWIFIIDLDHSPDPLKSGCGRADDQKTPIITLAIEVGNVAGCDPTDIQPLWDTREPSCFHEFRSPELRRAEGSHRFEAWYTKDKLITDNPLRPVGELREALQRSLQATHFLTSFKKFCLTYHDKNDNECHCVVPGKPYIKELADEGHPWPPTGIDQQDFFSRVGYNGQSGAVIYIIDVDGNNWYGRHRCGDWRMGHGTLEGILTNVGEPESCEEGSTKTALADGRFGCLVDWVGYRPPSIPVGEVFHEWILYTVGYRDTTYEAKSAAELQNFLILREADQVSLCFHFKEKTHFGPCSCSGTTLPQITIAGVKISDSLPELLDRIRFDALPLDGWIYIIDMDYSEKSWLAGCGSSAIGKTLKMILSIELGNKEVPCDGTSVTLWLRVPACIHLFDRPVLYPGETPHRFEVWYSRDVSTNEAPNDVDAIYQKLQRSLEGGDQPAKSSRTRYCLTYGQDDNDCTQCGVPRIVDPGELQVSRIDHHYPSQEDSATNFFRHFSHTGGDGGVMYVIDTDYDETQGKGGCKADQTPTGKIMAILTEVGHPASCPDSSTEIALGNGHSACMDESLGFTPLVVPEGDIMHEWKIYLVAFRYASAEKSASALIESLDGENSITLCFEEAMKYGLTGPCRCQANAYAPNNLALRLTVGTVTASDTAAQIAQRIHLDPLPDKGYIYIIDRDHDEGPQHAGCRDSSPTKRPKVIFEASVVQTESGCPSLHGEINGPVGSSDKLAVCVSKFSKPKLRPGDASHRLTVFHTTTRGNADEENDGFWLFRQLQALGSPSVTYCLTYGEDSNTCNCDAPPRIDPGAPQVVPIDGKYPSQGDTAVDFFRHFSITGDFGGVMYVIDPHYDKTSGKGGCETDRTPSGKIMAVLTNVGRQEACPDTSTKIVLMFGQVACLEKSFGFTTPDVPSLDLVHGWRIYASGYRFTLSEGSAATLLHDLEEEKIPRVTLCFGAGVKSAQLGPCSCEPMTAHIVPDPSKRVQLRDTIPVRIRLDDLSWSIRLSYEANSGNLYIIDVDDDEGSGPAGCKHWSLAKKPKIVFKGTVRGDDSRSCQWIDFAMYIGNEGYRNHLMCVETFSYVPLHPSDSSHRLQIWWTEHEFGTEEENDVKSLLVRLAAGDVGMAQYCLTPGKEGNDCHCDVDPNIPEMSIGRVSASQTPQDLAQRIHMNPLRLGQFYIIDRDHDEGSQHAGCGESSPTKRPKLILKAVANDWKTCPIGYSWIHGIFEGGRPMTLQVCVREFSLPMLRPGDASHRFEVYWAPYNLDDKNLSVVELREKLQATGVPPAEYCLTHGQDTHECLCARH